MDSGSKGDRPAVGDHGQLIRSHIRKMLALIRLRQFAKIG
jgi:hypothetical protein